MMQHTVTPESLKTISSLTQVNSAHRDNVNVYILRSAPTDFYRFYGYKNIHF